MTKLVDLLVDARILLNKRVGGWHVGFGLIVVVVRDEILDRIIREELAHFPVQLRGERLVGREYHRRPLRALDDAGHRERLARPGHAEEDLARESVFEPLDEAFDGAGLVAGRAEIGNQRQPVAILITGIGQGCRFAYHLDAFSGDKRVSVSVSERMAAVKPSPTGAVLALATRLRAEGRDIISLGTGEPDFDTPRHIREAAIFL